MSAKAKAIVIARDLTKYYGDKKVVKGVDFSVREGECFGFLGPNGAGKTTIMGMIYCFTPPSGGNLQVCGIDVGGSDKKIKALIGVAPQEDTLDPDLTVIENFIVYGRFFNIPRKDATARALELLDFMQLGERSDDTVSALSGGMKRRLVIARALINRPKLIVLDEPTTGLDPQARHLIWDRLKSLKKEGVTLLLTTHYMEEAHNLCDRLVIMDEGEFVAEGRPDELIKEKLEKEVIEILSREGLHFDMNELLRGLEYRHEVSGDREYLFAEDGDPLVKRLLDLGQMELLHRKSTLEDLFLHLTGRALEE